MEIQWRDPARDDELVPACDHVATRQDLVRFIELLRQDLAVRGRGWKNPTLER